MTKQDLRKFFLKRRDKLSKEEVCFASLEIIEYLSKDESFIASKSVMTYIPIRNEVNPIINMNIYKGKIVAVPKIIDNDIIPCVYKSPLVKSKLGTLEPQDCEPVDIDLCIVPGVCFDKHLHRIGYGGGFYDRFLSKNKHVFSIGICYDFQIVDSIEPESYDAKLNKIISQNYVIEGGYKWKLSL